MANKRTKKKRQAKSQNYIENINVWTKVNKVDKKNQKKLNSA